MINPPVRILVVEDEAVVAMGMEKDLSRLGYDVVGIADTSSEAKRLTANFCPELVLMDIQLRGSKTGIETAYEIRDEWQIPIIFVTGNSDDATFERARNTEPFGYLTKPYRTSDLNAAITLALNRSKVTRTLFADNTWLTTLLSSLSDGVVATDKDGIVRYLSPLAETLTGWHHAEALGKQIDDVYRLATDEGFPLSECQLRRVLRTGNAVDREEFLMLSKTGNRLFVEDAAAPIRDENGELIGAVSLFLDVTERRRGEKEREGLRRELERSNEELSRFSFALSHDLLDPSHSVLALAGLLLEGRAGQLNHEQQKLLTMMTDAAAGMDRLVKSMLQFAQVGHGELKREAVNLGNVIRKVETRLASTIEESGATIRCETLPVIEADQVQIEQLLQNLIVNAIKYRKLDRVPVIQISAHGREGELVLIVQDNGQGVPHDSLEKIFQPLKRLHGRDIQGSGLGLSLCRRIVERHGGRIWAESEGTGRGTTVCFALPQGDVV